MPIFVRQLETDAERLRHRMCIDVAFGEIPGPANVEAIKDQEALIEEAHTVAVFSAEAGEDEVIGGLRGAEFDLTMPGGATVPAVGVAGVGLHPARTGRGGLRVMMEEHIRRGVERGRAASVLWASESGLYPRFGYGTATSMAIHELATAGSTFKTPLEDAGHCDLVFDAAEARSLVAEVYTKLGVTRAGTTSRSDAWWDMLYKSPDGWFSPGPCVTLVHFNAAGEADGYAFYKVVSPNGGDDWLPDGLVSVREFAGLDVDAERAMIAFLCRVPLCRRVRFDMSPTENTIGHQLVDPREFRQVEAHDGLWLRPLDVVTLLEARTYESDGEVAFSVADPLLADQCGPWLLSVVDGVGRLTKIDSAPVEFSPEQLGMVLLGNTRVNELVAAGLVAGPDDQVRTLDRLMLTKHRPFTHSKF